MLHHFFLEVLLYACAFISKPPNLLQCEICLLYQHLIKLALLIWLTEGEDMMMVVPDNRLMVPGRYNQSAFTSMEMLKREEMAVLSVLGKIKRSTRPLSYVQTDI